MIRNRLESIIQPASGPAELRWPERLPLPRRPPDGRVFRLWRWQRA